MQLKIAIRIDSSRPESVALPHIAILIAARKLLHLSFDELLRLDISPNALHRVAHHNQKSLPIAFRILVNRLNDSRMNFLLVRLTQADD